MLCANGNLSGDDSAQLDPVSTCRPNSSRFRSSNRRTRICPQDSSQGHGAGFGYLSSDGAKDTECESTIKADERLNTGFETDAGAQIFGLEQS